MPHWLDAHKNHLEKAGFELDHDGEHTTHIKEKNKRVGTIQNTLSHINHFDVEGVSSKSLANHIQKQGGKCMFSSQGCYRLPKTTAHSEQEQTMLKLFEPQTQRQHDLVSNIKQYHAKHSQIKHAIQFSERNTEYFTDNIKVSMKMLQETVPDQPLEFNPETGDVLCK